MYGFFGLLHGIGLMINHIFNKYFNFLLPSVLGWILTFNFVNLTFIFFRSQNFEDGLIIISKMFGIYSLSDNQSNLIDLNQSIMLLIFCFLISLFLKNSYELFSKNLFFRNNKG
jgi:D-alanyl-lipoteichoic acid acyltransferase DltB (MBOAT superfamily)